VDVQHVGDQRQYLDRIDRTIAALLNERRRLEQHDVADGAYQGAPGAFSEDAARAWFGADALLRPCATLDDVFQALANGHVRAAVVPIENSLAGAVPGCADLIARHDVHIDGERIQPIAHALIAPAGVPFSAVRRVLSHPVAIAQCEAFFRAHPGIVPVPVFDTAGAVAEITRQPAGDAAAIASRRAATVYGGVVLADDIQDSADNFTRFLLIRPGPPAEALEAGRKTTVLCVLRNVPGALVEALLPFQSRELNLCRIESRPTRETPFEYGFHLDIGPAADGARLREALDELRGRSRAFRVLGHYEIGGAGL
jgi:prephenate dehydratase